ncbi:MAG: glycosyltransferase family 2 protein [Flavobacteriaceae bacterium]|nr:glycosyltransferase family 2 protein [Flavobacteriaceae bacterium]
MRIGKNPNIHKELELMEASHRVIIPVYIPNSEGYFEGGFKVFKVCMQSLLKSINEDTKISIISNASSSEVNQYIEEMFDQGLIDRAIFNSDNVGKMNAIVAETRASFEEFITYADADVFFDKGWLFQTYTMFKEVPKAGFVSMNPTPNNLTMAHSTVLANLWRVLKSKQKTSDVCNYNDLEHFHKSIGRDTAFTDSMFHKGHVICVGNNYIIGAGHFCCTIRKTPTLSHTPVYKSNIGVSGGSENKYLDIPFDKTGLWRLSSPKAYVWHMGNVLDGEWASNKLSSLEGFKEKSFTFGELPFRRSVLISSAIPYNIKSKLVSLAKKLKLV